MKTKFLKTSSVPASISIAIVSIIVMTADSYGAGFPKGPQAPLQELESATSTSASTTQDKKTTANEKKALTLGKVETEVENDLTIITARLSQQPTWKELAIEDHGTFLQIKLPTTVVPSSGEFFDGNGPFLKKIATFQVGNEDGAVRLFINQDAAKAKLATTAEILGERVIITIDHKKLEQLIQPAGKEKPAATAEVAPATLAATAPGTETTAASQAPAPEASANAATAVKVGSVDSEANAASTKPEDHLDLKGKLVTAAIFCAAMLMMLIGAQIWKVKRRKSGKIFKSSATMEPAAMKILSNLSLSARQKLSLVQVGNQQILLGVSPENITFLTNVESSRPAQNQSFGNHLLHADPNAEVKLKSSTDAMARPAQRRPVDAATTTAARPVAPRPKTIGPEAVKNQQATSRVNYAVGDEGIADLRAKGVKNDKGQADQPFDDITKLIRDRLRNLPPSP